MKTIYFSPTGTTRKACESIAKAWKANNENLDITSGLKEDITFSADDIVTIGVPVYSGRIPLQAEESIKKIHGQGTSIITLVMYGNRDYDDALLELNTLCEEQGFNVVASSTFIGEHSLDRGIASERPNEKDLDIAYNFGLTVSANEEIFRQRDIKVKGNSPYKERKFFPYHSIASDLCDECGHCARVCPTQAIEKGKFKSSINELCIGCMRCAKECHVQARQLNMEEDKLATFLKGLNEKCSGYKEPELFF